MFFARQGFNFVYGLGLRVSLSACQSNVAFGGRLGGEHVVEHERRGDTSCGGQKREEDALPGNRRCFSHLSVLDCSKLTEDCRNYVFDVVEYSELRERGRRTLIWSSFERDGEKVVFVALVQSDVHLFVFQVKHRRVAGKEVLA